MENENLRSRIKFPNSKYEETSTESDNSCQNEKIILNKTQKKGKISSSQGLDDEIYTQYINKSKFDNFINNRPNLFFELTDLKQHTSDESSVSNIVHESTSNENECITENALIAANTLTKNSNIIHVSTSNNNDSITETALIANILTNDSNIIHVSTSNNNDSITETALITNTLTNDNNDFTPENTFIANTRTNEVEMEMSNDNKNDNQIINTSEDDWGSNTDSDEYESSPDHCIRYRNKNEKTYLGNGKYYDEFLWSLIISKRYEKRSKVLRDIVKIFSTRQELLKRCLRIKRVRGSTIRRVGEIRQLTPRKLRFVFDLYKDYLKRKGIGSRRRLRYHTKKEGRTIISTMLRDCRAKEKNNESH